MVCLPAFPPGYFRCLRPTRYRIRCFREERCRYAGFTYPIGILPKILSKVISGYPISPAQGSNISPASHRHSLLLVSACTSRSSAASSAMAHVQSATNKLVWQLLPPGSPLHIAAMWGTNALPGVFQIRSEWCSSEWCTLLNTKKVHPSHVLHYCTMLMAANNGGFLVPSSLRSHPAALPGHVAAHDPARSRPHRCVTVTFWLCWSPFGSVGRPTYQVGSKDSSQQHL